jgi:hypothetical protein
MKYLRKFNEERDEEDEEYEIPTKGPDDQDVAHYEVIRKNGNHYLKVSTDDDTYYTKVMNQYEFDNKFRSYGGEQ